MGRRRIEAIEAGYAAANRGERDFIEHGYHSDAVFELSGFDIVSPTMSGAGVAEFLDTVARDNLEVWEESPTWRVEHVEELDAGHVLVEATLSARGQRSGIEVSRRIWHLYEYRGPKVARAREFDSRGEALAAVRAASPSR